MRSVGGCVKELYEVDPGPLASVVLTMARQPYKLACRASEILESKSDDNTSYEAIASAAHFVTEEILPKRAQAEP